MYKILNKTYTKLPTEDMEQEELVKWLIKNNYFFLLQKMKIIKVLIID